MTIIQGGVKITGFVQFTANYVPDVPTALTATWTTNVTNTVSLQFTAPVTSGSGPILSYTAVSNPAGFTATVSVSTNTVVIPGLSSSTYYVFNMYATNFAGNSELSTASNVVYGIYSSPILLSSYSVPPAPTSISAVITSTNATSTPSALVKFLPGTSVMPAASYSVLANGLLAGTTTTLPTPSYSGYFTGSGASGAYLVLSANANLVLGTTDFTIEMWVYPIATTNGSMLGNWTQFGGGDHGMKISYGRAVASKFEFFYSSSGQSSPGVMVSASTYAANAWYHVAAVRVGSTVTLYVNGVSAVSGTYSNDMYENYFYIGTENPGYNQTWFNGYISNLRIARYLAVYTGAFTPPTAPLSITQTNGTNISAIVAATTVTVLTLQNATSIVDNSSYARSITVNGATTSTAQPFDPYAYVTASNLSPLTSYTFQAYATNLVGNGDLSTTSSAITTHVTPGANTYTFPGCYTWKSPAGVTSVSVLAVGGGGSGAPVGFCGNYISNGGLSKFISSAVIQAGGGVSASQAPYAGAAGGGGTGYSGYVAYSGGTGGCTSAGVARAGGGAAGYAGAGGNANGSGTGGGGGGGVTNGVSSGGGGGVGLFGLGANGTVGSSSPGGHYAGYGGSGGTCGQCTGRGGLFGGGGPGLGGGGGGGGLAYINNYTVLPNTCYSVTVGVGGAYNNSGSYVGGSGALRIVWPGQIRSFPSTAVVCYANSTSSQFVPNVPTINSITANSGTAVTITYTAPTYTGGSAITSYTAISSDGNYYGTTFTSGSGNIFVKGLSTLTSYSFSIYATNSYGNSSNSGSLSTTTYAASSSIAYTIPGTYSWVVPAGVTAVSAIAIGGGASGRGTDGNNNNGGNSSFTMAALPNTVHISAGGGSGQAGGSVIAGTGFGGGNGGGGGCANQSGGGGGAGGYSAAGGAGGGGAGNDGATSTGGGGGGGRGQPSVGGGGGGVGLFGLGANGTGGVAPAGPGTGGSNGTIGGYGNGSVANVGGFGGWFGGGGGASFISGGAMPAGGGGALAYVNNLSVTSGSSYTVVVGAGGATSSNTAGGSGAVRILWPGQFRSFPSTNVNSSYDSNTDTLTPSKTYVPGAPILTSVFASSGTGITVNFIAAPSSYYFTPITSYTAVATTGTTSISASAASVGSILILGLTPLTRYTVSMYATSVYGSSTSSVAQSLTTLVASGEAVYTTPGPYSWVAPAYVTSVSAVAVGGGGSGKTGGSGTSTAGADSYFYNSLIVYANGGAGGSQGTSAGGTVGAGTGGAGGAGGSASAQNNTGGGGGAGGYSGAGGRGGNNNTAGLVGNGGGGGGGASSTGANVTSGAGGGGVGLYGIGCSGAAGVLNCSTGLGTGGGGGSGGANGGNHGALGNDVPGSGGLYGGGGGGFKGGANCFGDGGGGAGGALAYANNISVSSGTGYTVVVGIGGRKTYTGASSTQGTPGQGADGAVRIIWPGVVRSFPSTLTGCSSNL